MLKAHIRIEAIIPHDPINVMNTPPIIKQQNIVPIMTYDAQ